MQAAFRLRPEAGEAHLARAGQLYYGYRDYDGALGELNIARRTLPNAPQIFELTGYILRRRGQREEGLRSLTRAMTLDPRSIFIMQQIALSDVQMRRYAEAERIIERALSIKPDDADMKERGRYLASVRSGGARRRGRAKCAGRPWREYFR